jgi:23S rRNA pseudouridine1911/1915/1917 synthase
VKSIAFEVSAQNNGKRLDVFLAEQQMLLTRSQVQKAIADKRVQVNGIARKASYRLRPGEQGFIEIPDPVPLNSTAEALPLVILYEDHDLVVVNKPAGMVVHPACGNYTGTLVNALLYHCSNLSGIGGVLRPGIVHRLDKGTSGILVVAKTDASHRGLSRQFKDHSIVRKYQALVHGRMGNVSGTIETLIGRHPRTRQKMSTAPKKGRVAITHWKVAEDFPGVSLLEVTLETGRTHQVRVHLSSLGHPVVGDSLYGSAKRLKEMSMQTVRDMLRGVSRPLLHAGYLKFIHPISAATVDFTVPPPDDFMAVLNRLRAAP